MDYLISGDPVPGGMEPNEIHASPPREGAYSEGVEEYTVALRKDSKAKISKARASSRVAQRKFRENQKKRQAILEAKSQELEEAQEKRKSAEQQLERTEAEKVQLQFRVDRAEESCKVLQGVVKTLQKSHELLYGDTGGPRRGSNLLSSPATSQSGHEGRMAARQFSQPPAQFGKMPYRSVPMLSPISPMWDQMNRPLPTHPPSSLASRGQPDGKVPQVH